MSSGGGVFVGPSLPRADWVARFEKSLPGLRFVGSQGRLDRNGGFILVDLGGGDPLSDIEISWSGIGPGAAVRRVVAEHRLISTTPSDESALAPSPLPPIRSSTHASPQASESGTRRDQVVTASVAALGCAVLLMTALSAARPHLNAQLMAHNETLVLERLREMGAKPFDERLPVYAGYFFETYRSGDRWGFRARPVMPGATGGGWFILMDGQIYRDPEFDRLDSLSDADDTGEKVGR